MDRTKAPRLKRGRRMQKIEVRTVGGPNPEDKNTMFVSKDVWLVPSPQWRKRPSDSRTTSIRLGDIALRLFSLSNRNGLTPHAMMKEAIRRYIDRAEAEEFLAGIAPPNQTAADPDAAGETALAVYRDVIPGCGLTARMASHIANGVNPLRAIRGGRGFNVRHLAARLEQLGVAVEEELLARIEAGKATPTPKLLAALAQALGVTPGDLQG